MRPKVNMPTNRVGKVKMTIIMLLVVTLALGSLMIAVLKMGGTLLKPQLPIQATQQDYERLASEYGSYFEIGEDLTINLNLDRDVNNELESMRQDAYNEYVQSGSRSSNTRLGNQLGVDVGDDTRRGELHLPTIDDNTDYTDYTVWQDVELVNEIELAEISLEDRVLLEQYQAMLAQVNELVAQGIIMPVLEGDTLKYETVESDVDSTQDGDIASRAINPFAGRTSFDWAHNVITTNVPTGMKWFCQVIWTEIKIYIPVGYEINLSFGAAVIITAVLFVVSLVTVNKWMNSSYAVTMDFLSLMQPFAEVLIPEFDLEGLLKTVAGFAILGTVALTAITAFTGGVGAPIIEYIKIIMALVATYLFNRIGSQLPGYGLTAHKNNHNTIKINSDLVFWGNSFSTYRY